LVFENGDTRFSASSASNRCIITSKYAVTRTVFGDREEGPELLTGCAGTGVTEDDVTGRPPPPIEDGEQRLAAVVFEHECRRGGSTAPRRADCTAAADVLGRQQDEYLIDEDLLRQVLKHGRASLVGRHGAPSSAANWKDADLRPV
jgi:hypothetical protein